MFKWDVVLTYYPVLLEGALVTIKVSLLTIIISTILGTLVAMMRTSQIKLLKGITATYVWVFRGTPQLLVLFYIYYTFPSLGFTLSAFTAAIIGLSLNSTAYYSEIIRSGIEAIPKGQVESAIALGMSYGQIFRKIILPQAVKIIIPPYINNSVLLLKNSSLVSVITVSDLMLNAQQIYSATYRPVEILTLAGVLYLAMTSAMMLFQRWAEKRLSYYER